MLCCETKTDITYKLSFKMKQDNKKIGKEREGTKYSEKIEKN